MIRHRTLLAILTGCMMTFTGCHSSWQDRVDSRPMKYGSFSDKCAYWNDGPCDGYRPWYHCGSPDGIRDRKAVQHASISGANQALSEQFNGDVSRDFKFGFQQAFLDIANGGSGALPAVPPPRYWTAPYRTTWGHNKAFDWFEGYEAGANAAKCCSLREAQSVPTSVYRGSGNQVSVGLDGGGVAPIAPSMTAPPMNGWSQPSMSPYSPSPYQTNPWPQAPQPQSGYPASSPAMNVMPNGGWPSYPNSIMNPPSPVGPPVMSPAPLSRAPSSSSGHSITPGVPDSPSSAAHNRLPPSSGLSSNNPWNRFSGSGPSGFRSEGAQR